MRRFRFRLIRLLALREQEAEAARRALATALAAEATARRTLEELRARKAGFLDELAGGMNARELAARRRHLAALVETEAQAAAQVAARRRDVAARREALARAHQRQRMLERLRERRLAEYREETGRAEQAELDEWGGRGMKS